MLKRLPWTILVVSVALGFLIAVQFRTNMAVEEQAQANRVRFTTFNKVIERAEAQRKKLEVKIGKLRRELQGYRTGAVTSAADKKLAAEIRELQVLAGETKVAGPGLILTLDDRATTQTKIFSGDLKDIINIMRYGGAEAIAINGQRVVAQTAIHEAGRNLLVNKKPINRTSGIPYEILAIGNAKELEEYLRVTYGLLADLENAGVKVTITPAENLVLPTKQTGASFKLARPI